MLTKQSQPKVNRFLTDAFTRKAHKEAARCHPGSVVMLHDTARHQVWAYFDGATAIYHLFPEEFHYFTKKAEPGIVFPDQQWIMVINALWEAGYSCTVCGGSDDAWINIIMRRFSE